VGKGRTRACRAARRRARGESGAALVEFALVIVVVLAVVLGALTGGLAYNRKITLTDATRVAERYGATHAWPTTAPSTSCSTGAATTGVDQWLVDVACDAIANAQGELDPGSSGRVICVSYVPASPSGTLTGASELEWDSTNSGTIQTGQSCPQVAAITPSTTDGIVQVVAERTANFDAVVWDKTLSLESEAIGRYEQVQPS
jgi:Flp pilus assembly protein TadG